MSKEIRVATALQSDESVGRRVAAIDDAIVELVARRVALLLGTPDVTIGRRSAVELLNVIETLSRREVARQG
jgi:hypothetical protein